MDEVDERLFFEWPLPGQLPDDDRIGRARELEHYLGRQVIQRMRRDDERQLFELEILRGQPPVRQERPRDDGRRRNAPLFQVGRVVDTPRRAAPSVTPGVDERVDLALQLIRDQPARSEILADGLRADVRIVCAQHLLDVLDEEIRVRLDVVDEPDRLPGKGREAGREGHGSACALSHRVDESYGVA